MACYVRRRRGQEYQILAEVIGSKSCKFPSVIHTSSEIPTSPSIFQNILPPGTQHQSNSEISTEGQYIAIDKVLLTET